MTFGTQICGECGHNFCDECVVFPFGTKKPPLCISCALELGGVSSRPTGRPKLSRQSIRERRNAQRNARKLALRAERAAVQNEPGPVDTDAAIDTDGSTDPAAQPVPATPPEWCDDSAIETAPGGWSQTFK